MFGIGKKPSVSEEQVLNALRSVQEPDLRRDLVSLNMIKDLKIDDGTVSFKLIVANIRNVTMAHIHVAQRGVAGPIRQWLYPSGPPPQLRPGRTDGTLAEGTFTPTPELLAAIESGGAYVNVHTLQHPGGEIRGQLRAAH